MSDELIENSKKGSFFRWEGSNGAFCANFQPLTFLLPLPFFLTSEPNFLWWEIRINKGFILLIPSWTDSSPTRKKKEMWSELTDLLWIQRIEDSLLIMKILIKDHDLCTSNKIRIWLLIFWQSLIQIHTVSQCSRFTFLKK